MQIATKNVKKRIHMAETINCSIKHKEHIQLTEEKHKRKQDQTYTNKWQNEKLKTICKSSINHKPLKQKA